MIILTISFSFFIIIFTVFSMWVISRIIVMEHQYKFCIFLYKKIINKGGTSAEESKEEK